MTSGSAYIPAANRAPAIAGLTAAARLRGTEVTLAAAERYAGVTTTMTYEERVGTSIWESAARASRKAMARCILGEKAAQIKNRLDGRCVKTMVFTSPIFRDSQAATGKENAENTADQKKDTPAVVKDRPNLSNSHRTSRDCTANPPANESILNKAAIL